MPTTHYIPKFRYGYTRHTLQPELNKTPFRRQEPYICGFLHQLLRNQITEQSRFKWNKRPSHAT